MNTNRVDSGAVIEPPAQRVGGVPDAVGMDPALQRGGTTSVDERVTAYKILSRGGVGHGGRDERHEDEDVELQLALALSAADAEAPPALPPGVGRSAAPPGLGAPQRLAASASSAGLPPGLPPGLGR